MNGHTSTELSIFKPYNKCGTSNKLSRLKTGGAGGPRQNLNEGHAPETSLILQHFQFSQYHSLGN